GSRDDQGAYQQVQRHRLVRRFHLRHTRLAGSQRLGELRLGPVALDTRLLEDAGEPGAHRDQRRLFVRQPETLLGGSAPPASRALQVSITCLGVCPVFFANTSRITTASSSNRYMMRHVTVSSTIRSSWHRAPMLGIGREAGIPSRSPRWSMRSSTPASRRAALEKGGVLTSPCSQTSGLS